MLNPVYVKAVNQDMGHYDNIPPVAERLFKDIWNDPDRIQETSADLLLVFLS